MSNPLDRSLDDMRRGKEVDDMVIEDAERDELDQLGARLSEAYELSGEPPSLAAIEFAQLSVSLPPETPGDAARFNDEVRRRIEEELRHATGAGTLAGWVQQARRVVAMGEAEAATRAGVALPAYRQFEAGRMPVWRLPAAKFAQFCAELAVDASTLLRWASISAVSPRRGVYGRLDVDEEERSQVLSGLASESEEKSRAEFDEWRREFIAASEGSSEDDAP
jgi:hypothetical protein